jgi:hypothetical protein
MKLCILVLLLAQAAGDVALSGHVKDSVTHQPVIGARIQYQSLETASDQNGNWSLNVKPFVTNRELFISKDGYAGIRHYFVLKSGTAESHDFELSPAAHLSGRLVDRDSDRPVAGMYATLRRSNGGVFYADASGEDGSFHVVEDLPPGSYVMEVHRGSGAKLVLEKQKAEPMGYGQTWFPGGPRADMAAPIVLLAGEHREIEMRLQKRELRHISGVVQVPEGREAEAISMSLSAEGRRVVLAGVAAGAGPFRIEGLDEGSYELSALLRDFSVDMVARRVIRRPAHDLAFAIVTVEINGRDVDDLNLTMRPGVSIRADITMAEKDDKVPDKARLLLNAMPSSLARHQAGSPIGSLRFEGLPPGEYWPGLYFPDGYVVSSVSYAGRAVVGMPIDLEAPESTVHFVVTSRPAALTGIVRDSDQKPIGGAAIAVLPQPLPETMEKFDPAALIVTDSDGNGQFRLKGLPPGTYRAIALTGNDRERAHDLQFLRDRMQWAESITLDFGQTSTADLHVK